MKSFRDRNPYAVGLVSVAIIGIMTGLAFAVGLLHLLEDTYTMSGVFPDASGIRSGDQVRVAGVKVGRVTGIKADRQHGNVIVTWVVNSGVDLGADTTAEIALESLLGSKYLRLDGPVEEPFMEDLPDARRRIPVERTTVPFDIFELTRIGTRGIQATDTEKLNTFINDLADITEGKNVQVRDLVVGIDRVATAINERDTELDQLLDRADDLSGTLADKDETLVRLIDASRGVLDLIVQRRDELGRALGEGNRFVQELSRIITEHKAELDEILDTLHPTLDLVERHQPTLDTTIAYLGPGSFQQAQSGTHGPWQDIYVRSLGPDVVSALQNVFDRLPTEPAPEEGAQP